MKTSKFLDEIKKRKMFIQDLNPDYIAVFALQNMEPPNRESLILRRILHEQD